MTKQQLEQYRGLKKEIAQLEGCLHELEQKGPQMATAAVTSAAKFPFNKHTEIVTGLATEEYAEKQERLIRRIYRAKVKAEDERIALENYIESIPDASARTALRYRYIDGKGWLWISMKVYEKSDESYARRKIKKILHLADFAGFDDVQ